HVLPVDPTPVVRLENVQRERIGIARGHADAVGVVFDEKEQRKFLLPGETNRFEKISLASRGIADRRYDEIFFAVQLNAPGNAACGKKLRTCRGWHTPDVQLCVAVMRRHLAATAARVALREIFETELPGGHAAPEHEPAIPLIRDDI